MCSRFRVCFCLVLFFVFSGLHMFCWVCCSDGSWVIGLVLLICCGFNALLIGGFFSVWL